MSTNRSKSNLDLKFFWLSVTAVILIVVETNTAMLQNLRVVISIPVKPLLEVAQVPTRLGNVYKTIFEERELLRKLNNELVEENKTLRNELINLKNAEDRNAWMGELLYASEKAEIPVLSATPTSIQLEPLAQKIIVDRGSNDGVVMGQSVIDHRGVIGQVTSISMSDSAVTLLTDPNQSLSVRVRRSGVKAVVHGLGDPNRLAVSGLRSEQDVQVGDILVTTGFGEKFPAGYPVAEVIDIDRNQNAQFADISAVPLAAHDPGFQVLLVWKNNSVDSDEVPVVTLNDSNQE